MTLNIPNQTIQLNNLIGGQWQPGQGREQTVTSPYTGQVVGTFREASPEQVNHAAASAQEAFAIWRKTPLKERTQIMFRFREKLVEQLDEIANIVSLENGKTLGESKAGLMKGIEVLEFALSLQNLDSGGKMEVSRGVHCEYRREPLGVIANITPFNFPAMVPMWTIPIALTLGNSYIWKPSEKTPLTSRWISQALLDAGLPKGVFTVLQGGKDVVEAVIDHQLVKAVGFVGSSHVAELVYQRGSQLGKRVLALGGAKNHIVLLPDAHPEICGGISDSFTGCAGQRCMAASVLLAVGDCQAQIDQVVARAESQRAGYEIGAIISREQLEFLHRAIDQAVADGAKILVDGRKVEPPEAYRDGYWLGPTILDHVQPETQAATQELFGPILSIVRCNNISEAMVIENRNPYGNACSVFTNNGGLAEQVAQQAKAGMVGINIGVPVPREPFSFGGIGRSKFGHGDITGVHSLNFWSDMKKLTSKWTMQSDHNWMS
ncbi:aldehyde dehydrogenase family protein [Pseudobacteriovorax antillogorgiicola]|uniref:Malonate-semialdehyde dehydrogenase (Acetylating) / methylmalonate-semialdehyde dehydrogenase n=1 Tax=Pseudobacteriovorax antillogorgiicola TaxID=1513793 RepID=A0A1Y6CGA2_9BACT|nr:aldehyde dehydrogenase family protein [Pseudobacteriovorax antillogorgiicola]TCS47358.1 malonate-semialdehyde dehydrogenase (acetylating)/methylmalonate-semialdehyde dehydrogenase [Pseudobacteriovorax antillogorgiicola]SMF63309.1 malonate-semialdehyde dehydrogenase (acetylating) / methylmalonate-semialdehyde dehydrogenase [Pseudobacteriovorax antillogorgiicola]